MGVRSNDSALVGGQQFFQDSVEMDSTTYLDGALVLGVQTFTDTGTASAAPTIILNKAGAIDLNLPDLTDDKIGQVHYIISKTAQAHIVRPTTSAGAWATATFDGAIGDNITTIWTDQGWALTGRGGGKAAGEDEVVDLPTIA